jgi:hypothetical protein
MLGEWVFFCFLFVDVHTPSRRLIHERIGNGGEAKAFQVISSVHKKGAQRARYLLLGDNRSVLPDLPHAQTNFAGQSEHRIRHQIDGAGRSIWIDP